MTSVHVGRVSDYEDGVRKAATVDEREVVVFRHQSRFHAVENTCRHMGGPVAEGVIIGKVEAILDEGKKLLCEVFSDERFQLVCPWHGWAYDLETGEFAGDRRIKLSRYEVRVDEHDDVYIEGTGDGTGRR